MLIKNTLYNYEVKSNVKPNQNTSKYRGKT